MGKSLKIMLHVELKKHYSENPFNCLAGRRHKTHVLWASGLQTLMHIHNCTTPPPGAHSRPEQVKRTQIYTF